MLDARTIKAVQSTSLIYLLIPQLLFAVGWIRFPFSVVSALFVIAVILWESVELVRSARRRLTSSLSPSSRVSALGAALILMIWLSLSGVGGIGFQNGDYPQNNALLKDLIEKDWPISVRFKNNDVPLVYYTGYYLPAALVGKLLGWQAANIFVFVWTLVGLFLAFTWFAHVARVKLANNPFKTLLFASLFVLSGGMDLFGSFLISIWQSRPLDLDITRHREWWITEIGRFIPLQYSSMTTLLFWVPQHAIASWICTGLTAGAVLRPAKTQPAPIALALAASILWNPFGSLGTVPFLVVFLIRRAALFKNRPALPSIGTFTLYGIALWIAAITTLYLQANQFRFPVGFIWNIKAPLADLALTVFLFWMIEVGALSLIAILLLHTGACRRKVPSGEALLFRSSKDNSQEGLIVHPPQLLLFAISLVVLGLLPLFRIGGFNNLVMRSSIPSLFILFSFIGYLLLEMPSATRRRVKTAYLCLAIVTVAGFTTSGIEIARSIEHYRAAAPDYSSVGTTAEFPLQLQERAGKPDSTFFTLLGKPIQGDQ